jgi:hypothetical protein
MVIQPEPDALLNQALMVSELVLLKELSSATVT